MGKPFVVVGIDLAGSPRRPTGVCVIRGLRAHTQVAFSDEDILNAVQEARPDLVPIDAPLSLPKGRRTIQDRSGGHFRDCDLELRRRGIRFFPVTLGPMRMLTERGLALKAKIRAMGHRAIECYPGAAQDVWGIPRQHQDRKKLLAGLKKLGVRGLTKTSTSDELDAATAALVGQWALLGRGEMLGGADGIVVPSGRFLKKAASRKKRQATLVAAQSGQRLVSKRLFGKGKRMERVVSVVGAVRCCALLLLSAALGGCAAQHSPDTTEPGLVRPTTSRGEQKITYEGGDGLSCETAVLIKRGRSAGGVAAEYTWLDRKYPGYERNFQSLVIDKSGRSYDMLTITIADGLRVEMCFDITEFFGKE